MNISAHDQITVIKGVGPELAKKFERLGVRTVDDLVRFLPRRYEDYSTLTPLNEILPGPVSVRAKVREVKGRYVRRGMHVTEAVLHDGTDSIRAVWFNQPYRAQAMKPDTEYFLAGSYEQSGQRMQLMNPSAELAGDMPVNAARILPVYRETKGLTNKQIRKVMLGLNMYIETLPENFPVEMIGGYNLISHAQAYRIMHFPDSLDTLTAARRRLGFEEVFELILASLLNKQENAHEESVTIPFDENSARQFVTGLPFKLTDDQRRVMWQIARDMERTSPMNRLVEGDVGSGKTVVAAMAAMLAMRAGYQVALMAPTEILARQHAETLYKLLEPLEFQSTLQLLVGSLKTDQKLNAKQSIAVGAARFLVGTQALIQSSVDMHNLGLVIIDEQHRFGVDQRKTLMSKAGRMPHVLSLTATPIPRSLALTLYGELDISILSEKPPGRQPVMTSIISPNSRKQMDDVIQAELDNGRQLFVVCPLISNSDAMSAASAEATYDRMRSTTYKDYRIGLLHGKLKPVEKTAVMEQFARHELDILVSTTVIEVGVDVPNASVMVLEGAERFGLAQAHQLRGRVGRGGHKGYCFLVLSDSKPPSQRLRALESSNDGFKLAELDLSLRGPGAIYGQLQHGALDLRVARLSDTRLLADAREAAETFIASGDNLLNYKALHARVTALRAVTNLN